MLSVATSYETVRVSTGFAKSKEVPIMKCQITPPVFGNVQINGIRPMYWKDCDNHALVHAIACLAVRDIMHGSVAVLSKSPSPILQTLNGVRHITGPEKQMVEVIDEAAEDDETQMGGTKKPRFEEIVVIETTSIIDAEVKIDVGRHDLTIRLENTEIPAHIASAPHPTLAVTAARHMMEEICTLIDSYVPELLHTVHVHKDAAGRIAANQPLPHGVADALGITEVEAAS